MWQQGVNGILGIVAIIALYPYISSNSGRTLLVIIGVAVALFGFWGAFEHTRKHFIRPPT